MNAAQLRMARAALKLGIRDVARLAIVAPSTVSRLEAGEKLNPRTMEAIRRALEAAGIEFTNGDSPGVRLKNKSK
jgi:transcriptional regulator with XRE-family HTH domain